MNELNAGCPALSKPEHMARAANRLRQRLRPEDPKDLDFEIMEDCIPQVEHLKNKGIHLNGDGVKILASNFIRQALKAKIKAAKHKRKRDPLWLLAQTLNKIIRTSSAS